MAVVNKNEALAKALLAAGADPTLPSRFGETPIDVAANAKADKLVDLLRSHSRTKHA
jgi:ankyrin repeat protein